MLAPICLFVFERHIHTKKVLDFLALNDEAIESDLYVYCDGIPDKSSEIRIENIQKTREIVSRENRFNSVTIKIHKNNLGLANSIIFGVSEICNIYEKVIVIEDDILVSPSFLKYMNDGLKIYNSYKSIGAICAFMYPINVKNEFPETFLLSYNSCWGWATWSSVWKNVNFDGKYLLDIISKNNTKREFNFNNTCPHVKMLKQQINGKNNSWAIRWAAFLHINNLFSVFPKKSLVKNIGFDGTGVHSGNQLGYQIDLFNDPIQVVIIDINENIFVRKTLEKFFKRNNSKNRILQIKRILSYSPNELFLKIIQKLK